MFEGLFGGAESLVAIDMGSANVKLLELDLSQEPPRILNVSISAIKEEVITNNAISKPDKVAEIVGDLLESNSIKDKRIVTAVPGPSVFTKRIKMQKVPQDELRASIQLEAGNFIPHNIDAVKLDYHVLGEVGKNQIDVLVVAVKNEIIESYVDCLGLAGLETAVVDVDYFALHNVFELCYPEMQSQTVGLINVGARYSGICISRGGEILFTGDVSIGGKQATEDIMDGLGITMAEAEALKKAPGENEEVKEIIARHVEHVATEFNRQLSFFWNASGVEGGIDTIMLSGGGSLLNGLVESLAEKTGVPVSCMDPLKGLQLSESIDPAYLVEIGPMLSIVTGLGVRRAGDRDV